MSEESIVKDIIDLSNSVSSNSNTVDGLIAISAVTIVTIIIKILYKSILARLFSSKPLVYNKEGEGATTQAITEENIEKKNTSLEERLALRIKATLEPAFEVLKKGQQQNHECIVRLEQKMDTQNDAQLTVNDNVTRIHDTMGSKLDKISERVNEHIGYGKAVTDEFFAFRSSNKPTRKSKNKPIKRRSRG